jgi:4-amino-4-deoxy-L-arabinose transferase-like glycosyltransferase
MLTDTHTSVITGPETGLILPATQEPVRKLTPVGSPKTSLRLHWPKAHIVGLLTFWLTIFLCASWSPPLLDDADATHAQAAQAMLRTGDWVTLHVDGIRYLEKPPLPYWIAATSLRLFGNNSFAIHLPLALTALGLALLAYAWSRRAFGSTSALYSALFVLTSVGTFLFTRFFIPDALLSLLLAASLYAFLRALHPTSAHPRRFAYLMWSALALAVLTKGFVALVFFIATTAIFVLLSPDLRRKPSALLSRLFPVTGFLLFFAIAAPWHILAGLRNTGGANGHGFFWFYFINEHVLRFLGRRIPRDYNKLPFALYWLLHLVWLFPWSLFAPAAAVIAWKRRAELRPRRIGQIVQHSFKQQTILLLSIFSATVLLFFSFSTNQEYYTLPVYLPLLVLLAGALASIRKRAKGWATDTTIEGTVTAGFVAYAVLGISIATALAYGLWTSRHLPFVPDIGDLLAHRGVGDYTLSMSHFFDLTGPSFAALRTPAFLAAISMAIGPLAALAFQRRHRLQAALLTVAATSALFLIAAHVALVRFSPMLSSANFANKIKTLEATGAIAPNTSVLLYGDQSYGSSIPFYLGRQVFLVNGRSTSMLFGSTFPDAPPIFLTPADLLAQWGTGPRKLLFVPLEKRNDVDALIGKRQIILSESSGKALITDRPLNP